MDECLDHFLTFLVKQGTNDPLSIPVHTINVHASVKIYTTIF